MLMVMLILSSGICGLDAGRNLEVGCHCRNCGGLPFTSNCRRLFVIGAAVGLGLGVFGVQLFRRRQVWLMAALGIILAGLYSTTA
jgi:hypothetical protein